MTFLGSIETFPCDRGRLESFKRFQRTLIRLLAAKNSSSVLLAVRKITVLSYISRKDHIQESDIFLPVCSYRAQDLHSYCQRSIIIVQSRDPYVIYMRLSDSLFSGSSYMHEKVVIAPIVFDGNSNFFVLYLRISISDEVKRSPWQQTACMTSLKRRLR